MQDDFWIRLGALSPSQISGASLELHWAAQFVAAAGGTFAEPHDDDSHRAMSWDSARRAFKGEPFAGRYPFRIGLRPVDLTLLFLDQTDEPLSTFPLAGHTLDEAYEWIASGAANYMGSFPQITRPEYEMPKHPVREGGAFARDQGDQLDVLEALYETSATALAGLTAGRDDASPIRCWPHHFDIATLITVDPGGDDAPARTVGVGMAPSGGGYDHWYWYVSPYPFPDAAALPELEGPGKWHTSEWTGAVLLGEDVIEPAPDARAAGLRDFLAHGLAASVQALGA